MVALVAFLRDRSTSGWGGTLCLHWTEICLFQADASWMNTHSKDQNYTCYSWLCEGLSPWSCLPKRWHRFEQMTVNRVIRTKSPLLEYLRRGKEGAFLYY